MEVRNNHKAKKTGLNLPEMIETLSQMDPADLDRVVEIVKGKAKAAGPVGDKIQTLTEERKRIEQDRQKQAADRGQEYKPLSDEELNREVWKSRPDLMQAYATQEEQKQKQQEEQRRQEQTAASSPAQEPAATQDLGAGEQHKKSIGERLGFTPKGIKDRSE